MAGHGNHRLTRDQQKLLNALCGDLERQVCFDESGHYANVRDAPNGRRLAKDDWRHALAGKAKGAAERYIPDWDSPEKKITLATSSLKLTVEEAGFAIEMAYALGAACGVVWWGEEEEMRRRAQYEQEAAG